MADNTTEFEAITIGLASSEEIRSWSYGEVKKPETINYRTFKPERDGLFCERIFGPSRDWECHCGKYKKVKFKGIICDRCGVEVTRRKVRRERMGHIELAAPVCHSWYLKGVPSPISLLLDMSRRLLEEVIYFASYLVTAVNSEKLQLRRDEILLAIEEEKEAVRAACEEGIQQLRERYEQGLRSQQEAESSEQEQAAAAEKNENIEELALDIGLPGTSHAVEALPEVMDEQELSRRIQQRTQAAQQKLNDLDEAAQLLFELTPKQLISEMQYRKLRDLVDICQQRLGGNFDDLFKAGLGAEAVYELLEAIDLDELAHELRQEIDERTGARRARAIKRLKIVEAFRGSKNRPEWMILSVIPVLPPELRPMVQLDGGRFATSDLNDLYRRVINRNNRLRRIMEINAPESIINHERRLLQEAVDALIDNNRRSRPVTGSNRRPLKSLSDMLKGKEGRFRKNLLGKRVDYSGRSVIVVGPELELHQCGLPREMALELFKPFVMNRLVEQGHTTNIKTAKRMVDRVRPEVWDALEEVIEDHPVLLNRAPTLHRLGIQAFEPVLIDGKAIQLHPLVCQAFNADFDGDQMAVHVPLSAQAQAEARLLMLANGNLFKPADGSPIAAPLYDVVLGCYYMTQENPNAPGAGKIFESAEAVITAYEHGRIDLHASIKARLPEIIVEATDSEGKEIELNQQLLIELRRAMAINVTDEHPPREREVSFQLTAKMMKETDRHRLGPRLVPTDKDQRILAEAQAVAVQACEEGRLEVGAQLRIILERKIIDTTAGRVIFNSYLPLDMPYVNQDVVKGELAEIAIECYRIYGQERTAELLDQLKEAGFKFATRSGLSICLADTDVQAQRGQIINRTEKDVERINKQARDGAILPDEREQEVLRLWQRAREAIVDDIFENIDTFNSIWMMTNSGARASRSHISQICGMRGLMTDPFGHLIEDLPVKSNFHEGLSVLEYFVSTHGARKGLADTALRTADAGYLTRRLVDVAQDVIIRGIDCGTTEGIELSALYEHELHCPHCGQEDVYREGKCQFCGTELPEPVNDEMLETLRERIVGRTAAVDIVHPKGGEVIVRGGEEITEHLADLIEEAGIKVVTIRSPLTCELRSGVCAKCYGRDLARQKLVEVGTAIGIIAAQSIGEPGTQLTMRTFHTGGIAGEYITGVADVKKRKQQALRSLSDDIDQGRVSLDTVAGGGRAQRKAIKEMLKVLESSVHGLLRVVELFEARTPKGQAITAQLDGVVAEIEERGLRTVIIHSVQPLDQTHGERLAEDVVAPGSKEVLAKKGQKVLKKVRERLRKAGVTHVTIAISHLVPYRGELYVKEGTEVRAGDRLTAGPVDPENILRMKGLQGVQGYLLRGIQQVYRGQGVSINDKHIEVIIRQMLRKRKILDHGDTKFLPGEIVDCFAFEDENARVLELGGTEATAEPVLLGITQASLATESFLSAASFQRTTRVLTDAACEYKRDPLQGLKENVIIGRLIPAGSGMPEHRDVEVGFSESAQARLEARPIATEPEQKDAMEQLLADIEVAKETALAQSGIPEFGEEISEEDASELTEEEVETSDEADLDDEQAD